METTQTRPGAVNKVLSEYFERRNLMETTLTRPASDERRSTTDPAAGGGKRYSAGKNRMDLMPPEWEWELCRVLTKGAAKYAERNWEKGMEWSAVIGPLKRHLNKFLRGEQLDDEIAALVETVCHFFHIVLRAVQRLL